MSLLSRSTPTPSATPLALRSAGRASAIVCATVATCACATAGAQQRWQPDAAFMQAGVAHDVYALVAGAAWDWTWQRQMARGRASGYWEASFGRWRNQREPDVNATAWVTQVGVTPVLRWQPDRWGDAWFIDAGVGANWLLPVFRSGDKRFSTTFNFGDHIAIGRLFGPARRHEIVLRLQHFSNAGIKKPNPGENFLQLRYSLRY